VIRTRCSAALAALLAGGLMISPVYAQDQTTTQPQAHTYQLLPRVGITGEMRITLEDAIRLAVSNNKDIDASKIDREEADYTVLGARGAFDPIVGANSLWQQQIQPVASSLGGSTTGDVINRTWQTDPSVSQALPWLGGSYKIDLDLQKVFTNNSFVTLNPQYPTALNFQFTQPLLRGMRYDANRHALDVAKKNRSLTDQQFRESVIQVVSHTNQAYWELAYAYNNLEVEVEAVNIALGQDESNRRQEQQGLLAPIDIVAAQTQLANFELDAQAGQVALTQAENSLKLLILPDRDSTLWSDALVPATAPDLSPPHLPLPTAVDEALANRPEILQAKISAQINKDDITYYRSQTKPEVDLVVNYDRAGLSGLQVPQAGGNPLTSSFGPLLDRINLLSADAGLSPIDLSLGSGGTTQFLVGNLGQSLNNLWRGNFPTTEVQLRVSLPIHNRSADANLLRSRAEQQRVRDQTDQTEQSIEADVRNTMQAMESADLRLRTARLAQNSAEEQYNSEQRQFHAGTSTLFLVQTRQSAMIAARSAERRAESDLAEAISSFQRATGSLLKEHNINLRP
jgi:outer membrane protein TolC